MRLVLRCVEDLELWIVCTGDLVHVELLRDVDEHILIHFNFARLFVDIEYTTDQRAGIDHIVDALRFPNAEAQIIGHGDQDLPKLFLAIDGRGIDRTEDLVGFLFLDPIPGSGRGHCADATVGTSRDTEFGTIGRTTRATNGVTPPGTEVGTVGTALFTLDRTDTNAQANARVTEIGTTTTLFGTVVDAVIGTAVLTLLRTVDVTGSLTTGTTQGATGTALESACLHTRGALVGALLHTHGSTTRSNATDTAVVVTGTIGFGPTNVAATTPNTVGGTGIGATTTALSSCLRRAVLITIRLTRVGTAFSTGRTAGPSTVVRAQLFAGMEARIDTHPFTCLITHTDTVDGTTGRTTTTLSILVSFGLLGIVVDTTAKARGRTALVTTRKTVSHAARIPTRGFLVGIELTTVRAPVAGIRGGLDMIGSRFTVGSTGGIDLHRFRTSFHAGVSGDVLTLRLAAGIALGRTTGTAISTTGGTGIATAHGARCRTGFGALGIAGGVTQPGTGDVTRSLLPTSCFAGMVFLSGVGIPWVDSIRRGRDATFQFVCDNLSAVVIKIDLFLFGDRSQCGIDRMVVGDPRRCPVVVEEVILIRDTLFTIQFPGGHGIRIGASLLIVPVVVFHHDFTGPMVNPEIWDSHVGIHTIIRKIRGSQICIQHIRLGLTQQILDGIGITICRSRFLISPIIVLDIVDLR